MTDIRERAARAICEHDALRLHPDEIQVHRHPITGELEKRPAWQEHLAQADAVLSAIQYREIREALEKIVAIDANMVPSSEEYSDAIDDAFDRARAALAKEGA